MFLVLALNNMRYTTRLFPDPRDKALIQIKNILAPGVADPHGHWHSCKLDINNCSSNQLDLMQGELLFLIFFLRRRSHLNFKILQNLSNFTFTMN
jgi:hypothetical protein